MFYVLNRNNILFYKKVNKNYHGAQVLNLYVLNDLENIFNMCWTLRTATSTDLSWNLHYKETRATYYTVCSF